MKSFVDPRHPLRRWKYPKLKVLSLHNQAANRGKRWMPLRVDAQTHGTEREIGQIPPIRRRPASVFDKLRLGVPEQALPKKTATAGTLYEQAS
ncbi:hypothetical protein [Salipiger pallidus]|nr:hypothetical protein [Salipiger pallidus]